MNRLGFKNILIIVVTGLLILALGLTCYLSITKLEDTTKTTLVSNIIRSSQYESKNLQGYIKSHSEPVIKLAELYSKYDYQTGHEKYMEIAQTVTDITKLTLGFDDGRSYTSRASESFPGGVGILSKYDPRTRSWYQLGKKSAGLKLSEVFATKQGALLLLAVHPVAGGVVASDVRLTHLQTVLEGIDIAEDSVGIIVDQKGMVLASTTAIATTQDQVQDISELSGFANRM
ncbi:cache domain-containing protein [Psychromonas sp.]|nr:cache domain-containing protein [Psychromonas sp.]